MLKRVLDSALAVLSRVTLMWVLIFLMYAFFLLPMILPGVI